VANILSLNCFNYQEDLTINTLLILANVVMGVGITCNFTGSYSRKEVRIQVLAGLAPSSQKVGSFLRTPVAGKAGQKNDLSTALIFVADSTLKNLCIF
jgi:hypothetical protein